MCAVITDCATRLTRRPDFRRGFKAQIFLTEAEVGAKPTEQPAEADEQTVRTGPAQGSGIGTGPLVKLSVLASTRVHLQLILDNLEHIEAFFPGLKRVETLNEVQTLAPEPVQVSIIGGQQSISSLTTARAVQQLLQVRSGEQVLTVEDKAGDHQIRVELPVSELRFMLEVRTRTACLGDCSFDP